MRLLSTRWAHMSESAPRWSNRDPNSTKVKLIGIIVLPFSAQYSHMVLPTSYSLLSFKEQKVPLIHSAFSMCKSWNRSANNYSFPDNTGVISFCVTIARLYSKKAKYKKRKCAHLQFVNLFLKQHSGGIALSPSLFVPFVFLSAFLLYCFHLLIKP